MSAPLTNDNRMVHPYTLEKTWRATSPETFCWLSKTLYQASVVSWHVLNVLFAYRRDRNKFCSTWTDKNKREKADIHSGIPIHAAERWPQESQQSRSSGPILNTYSEAGIPSYKTVWRNNNVKKKKHSPYRLPFIPCQRKFGFPYVLLAISGGKRSRKYQIDWNLLKLWKKKKNEATISTVCLGTSV